MLQRWYQSLADREKLLLLAAAMIALILLLWGLVWQPLSNHNQQLRNSLQQKASQLAWMQQAAEQIKTLQQNARPVASGSLQQRLTRNASQLGIDLSRIQNSNDGQLKVWIDKTEFNRLLQLIDQLAQQGARVDQIHIQPLPQSGYSKARLTLAGS
jgi:general secretion pathway protein M